MTEQEFWLFLEKMWQEGRAQQRIGIIDCENSQLQKAGEYLQGHALLPRDYGKLGAELIVKMGSLLFKKEVSDKTKEAVMMLLAHNTTEVALTILAKYNLIPDKGLEFFAQMALEECAMWNE